MNSYEFMKSFSLWASANAIALVLLRPQVSEQSFLEGDLDILIRKNNLKTIAAWIKSQSIKIISVHKRQDGVTLYLQGVGSALAESLHIDFLYTFEFKGQAYLTPETVIQRSIEINGIVYPDPVDQMVILLITHGLKHKSVPLQQKHSQFIQQTIRENRDSSLDFLTRILGSSNGYAVFDELKEKGYSTTITKSQKVFHTAMWKTYGLVALYHHAMHYLNEMFLRLTMPKYTVIFLGVDGSGKTTLTQNVLKALEPYFDDRRYFHLLPMLEDQSQNNIWEGNPDPHALPARSLVISCTKAVLYCIRYYIFLLLPLKKPSVFLLDRHLCDMMADPKRFRVNPAHLDVIAQIIKWAPKPDIAIVLNVSAAVAQSRKQEVPFAETERQVIAYKNLAQHIDNSILINAEMTPEAVTNIAVQHIFDCLDKKTAQHA